MAVLEVSLRQWPLRTYPETGGNVVEWRRAEQKFKGAEEEDEIDEQNQTVASQ